MKTKYGQGINPDDFPYYGQFGNYVRQTIDSEWGMGKEREITKKRKYRVDLGAMAQVSTTVYVDAADEEEAKTLAEESARGWAVDDVDEATIEVFNVCEKEDED